MANRRKYQWDRWFSEPRTVLRRGVEYDCSQATMVQAIRNAASARLISIRLDYTESGVVIHVVGKRGEAGEVYHTDQAPVAD